MSMRLDEYLKPIDGIVRDKEQRRWFLGLEEKARKGWALYRALRKDEKNDIWDEFRNRSRTEEIKAWYSAPEGDTLFQGTSISSLSIPYCIPQPLKLESPLELEEKIADAYIELHDKYHEKVRGAILEDIDEWIGQGLYYAVVVSAKVISQALGLSISSGDVIFNVDGHRVDPHELISYPPKVRKAYFEKCLKKIRCFGELDIEQRELESCLVLSDISKPKLEKYRDRLLLAPIRCNEIAALMSGHIAKKIEEKTSGRIRPKGLAVVIYDTDTPYGYHKTMGHDLSTLSPVLPGLTILGASGTIDAFRWLYAYRLSLISQKIQKSSLYSEVERRFIPFVFFGVLVWRDAQILLDLSRLSMLRYRGNLSPDLEFAYLIEGLSKGRKGTDRPEFSWDAFRKAHSIKNRR